MDNELFQLPLNYQVHRLRRDLPRLPLPLLQLVWKNISRFKLAKIVTLINLIYWI